jgi:hypothetical protein
MCQYMHIRHEHTMRHPHYPDVLGCGCICSGHMSGDPKAAKQRQRDSVSRAKNAKTKAKREPNGRRRLPTVRPNASYGPSRSRHSKGNKRSGRTHGVTR